MDGILSLPSPSPGVLPQHHRAAIDPGGCRFLRSQSPGRGPLSSRLFSKVASLPSCMCNKLPIEANSKYKTNCFLCFFTAPISPNLYHRNDTRHSYDRRQINRSRIGAAHVEQRESLLQWAFVLSLAAFLHSDCFFRSAPPGNFGIRGLFIDFAYKTSQLQEKQ